MADLKKNLKHTTDELDAHLDAAENHVTAEERAAWNKTGADLSVHTGSTSLHTSADEKSRWDTAAEQAAINRSTLGFQAKNKFKPAVTGSTILGAVTYALADGKITLSGTPGWNGGVALCGEIIADKDMIISGWETLENIAYLAQLTAPDGSNSYPSIPAAGLTVKAGYTIKQIYVQRSASHSGGVSASIIPMVRYADITDDSYAPYQPSVQEQMASLLARIEALEAAAATTTEV